MDSASRQSSLARERSGFLTIERIRRIEATALSLAPAGDLMARAAAAICERADALLRRLGRGASVMAAIGPGNNGGDALLALTLLARRGYSVLALSESDAPPSAPEANAVHGRWRAQGGGFPVTPVTPPASFRTTGGDVIACDMVRAHRTGEPHERDRPWPPGNRHR